MPHVFRCLMYVNFYTIVATACQLGIKETSVKQSVHEIFRKHFHFFLDKVNFSTTTRQVGTAMESFETIAGFLHSVDAIDGTQIPWLMCPSEQCYEYSCGKWNTSVASFVSLKANRRLTLLSVGSLCVLKNSTIFENICCRKPWMEEHGSLATNPL